MNDHYNDAVAGLNELVKLKAQGVPTTEATALAAIQTRATLAVAEEQAKTNTLLETANLIAYAQLCHTARDGAKFMKARRAADKAMRRAMREDF